MRPLHLPTSREGGGARIHAKSVVMFVVMALIAAVCVIVNPTAAHAATAAHIDKVGFQNTLF